MDEKLAHIPKLLAIFKDVEQKLSLGRDTPIIIAGLMKKDIFLKTLTASNKLDEEKISLLKSGKANHSIVITAKSLISKMVTARITEMSQLIHASKEKEDTTELDRNLSEATKNLPADKNKKSKRGQFLSKKEDKLNVDSPKDIAAFYNSYFSNFALSQMGEHMKTGNAPPSYKRKLSIAFIDIVGFSTIAEVIEPEQLIDVLNLFFGQVCDTIQTYNGDIDKFLGDALLVTFEESENAVRCALEIIFKDLDIINLKLDYMDIPDLQIHFGVNTGWVVHGYVGSNTRRETTVIGDGVNVAARIQGIAPPNKLWVSASTLTQLGKVRKLFSQVGRRKLKGRMQEIMIYNYDRKVPEDHLVILYESDKKMAADIQSDLNAVKIKNIKNVTTFEEAKQEIKNPDATVLTVGPSVPFESYKGIIAEIDEQREGKLSLVPIIREKVDSYVMDMFEQLNLNVYVPKYKERGVEKLLNLMANESMRAIPKKEKEEEKADREKPVEEGIMGRLDSHYQTEQKEGLERFRISVSGTAIDMNIQAILSKDELSKLKTDLKNLWEYSFQKGNFSVSFNMSLLKTEDIPDHFLNDLLDILAFNPNPKKINIKTKLPNDYPMDIWMNIQKEYKYSFQK